MHYRNEEWTAVNIKKDQMAIINAIAKETKLRKCDIVEMALRSKYPKICKAMTN